MADSRYRWAPAGQALLTWSVRITDLSINTNSICFQRQRWWTITNHWWIIYLAASGLNYSFISCSALAPSEGIAGYYFKMSFYLRSFSVIVRSRASWLSISLGISPWNPYLILRMDREVSSILLFRNSFMLLSRSLFFFFALASSASSFVIAIFEASMQMKVF